MDYHDADINECKCGGVPEFDNVKGDEISPRLWRLECPQCNVLTDWCSTPWEAIEAWNSLSSEVYV